MGLNLVRVSQSGIEKAALDAGLVLSADQVRDIAEAESSCLVESRRVSFGESAAVRIVRAFGGSPFMTGDDSAEVISKLTEAFYELRGKLFRAKNSPAIKNP